ncbi:hypothetical protein [Streptomyces galbus]|uniref:Uncharacterized protein n=1 Tax=Streptomyces galbus TaxID=33898 RepID=A0ABX1IQY5_STRGB|nr:hypothetical protein [Streptomyces galbus]NKQ28038.1 hypothetical protein [Streptomyces galbus]
MSLATPYTFVRKHGDPATWCAAEFDEYLSVCDRARDVVERLERAAAAAAGGAATADIVHAFRTGGVR